MNANTRQSLDNYITGHNGEDQFDSAEPDITEVIFRAYVSPDGFLDLIALFPYVPETFQYCMSYQHIGQHGGADYSGVIGDTRPATPDEYADLKSELESIGYNLKVIQRKHR